MELKNITSMKLDKSISYTYNAMMRKNVGQATVESREYKMFRNQLNVRRMS